MTSSAVTQDSMPSQVLTTHEPLTCQPLRHPPSYTPKPLLHTQTSLTHPNLSYTPNLSHPPDGSTAICCMLQRVRRERFRVLVANVGDSRAALVFRDGSARPLSRDHKPDLPAERARVEATGGQVVFAGCWRVQGDLAVSRAFGDCHLKRWGVIAAPELVTYVLDTNLHRWLVLASDGLWDVMSESQVANPSPPRPPPPNTLHRWLVLGWAMGCDE